MTFSNLGIFAIIFLIGQAVSFLSFLNPFKNFANNIGHANNLLANKGSFQNAKACTSERRFWQTFQPQTGVNSFEELKSKNPDAAGAGNFGKVYPCGVGKRNLAFKYTIFNTPDKVETIEIEMQSYLAVGTHNYIAKAYGCFVSNPPYYGGMLLERLGKTLEKNQNFVLSLPIPQRAIIYRKISRAINYVHYKGLCHNDIKPDNILQSLFKKLVFKIIDLGVACKIGEVCTIGFTLFAAPEKYSDPSLAAQHSYVCQPSVDIWAFALSILFTETRQKNYEFALQLTGCQTMNYQCAAYLSKIAQRYSTPQNKPFIDLAASLIGQPAQQRNSMEWTTQYLQNLSGGTQSQSSSRKSSRTKQQIFNSKRVNSSEKLFDKKRRVTDQQLFRTPERVF